MAASIPLVKLEDQLTCGRCHNLYTKPRTLSCLHSFCQHCIEGFPTIPTFFVACPTCHQHTELPDHAGAAGFSVAPQIIDLRRIYEEAKKQSIEAKCANCSSGDPFGFCKDCNQFLCNGCIDTHKKWAPLANHVILGLEEALKVPFNKSPMDKEVAKPKNAIDGREAEIREQGEAVKEEIRSFLKSVGDKFIKEVDEIVERKLQMLEKQRKVSPNPLLEPIEKADIQFIKGNNESISHHVGRVVSSAGLEECKVKEITTVKHIPEEKAISFQLSIELPDDGDSLLVLPASSLSLNVVPATNTKPRQVINARVIPTDKPGVYQVICTPVIRGCYEVTVKALGIQLGMHRSLLIPINPYTDEAMTPVRTIYGVCGHHDIAMSHYRPSHILVSETGSHVISIFDKDGQKRSSIGKGQNNITFSTNQGIAVASNGCIFVADYGNHRIQKLQQYPNKFLASVGSEGAEPLQFSHPVGIAISPIKNRVYIADYGNKRVQVLNDDLTFCRMFGKEGKGNGEFGKPHDIAIDKSGFVYVADSANCLVQKFTHDGKFLSQFGKKGSGPGDLHCPVGIAVDNAGLLYITENVNHRVSIFTDEGVFVRSFGEEGPNEDQFKTPYFGLTFDEDGYLYICDTLNKRLVVY